jgi:hypothetical protein
MAATTMTMIIAELCFLSSLTLFSRNFTRGFAIIATIQPITKGIKKPRIFGSSRKMNSTARIAMIKLMTILRYTFGSLMKSPVLPKHREFWHQYNICIVN